MFKYRYVIAFLATLMLSVLPAVPPPYPKQPSTRLPAMMPPRDGEQSPSAS